MTLPVKIGSEAAEARVERRTQKKLTLVADRDRGTVYESSEAVQLTARPKAESRVALPPLLTERKTPVGASFYSPTGPWPSKAPVRT